MVKYFNLKYNEFSPKYKHNYEYNEKRLHYKERYRGYLSALTYLKKLFTE